MTGRFIGELIRLISDIVECTEVEQMKGYMFAADIEEAFDSIDHNFLIESLAKDVNLFSGLKHYFMINKVVGQSASYFALKLGSRHGDPLSAILFLLTIEVLFIMLKSNVNIKGLNRFKNEIKLIACADDTTLFLIDLNSFHELLSLFQIFDSWSSLKFKFG